MVLYSVQTHVEQLTGRGYKFSPDGRSPPNVPFFGEREVVALL